LLLLAAPLRAQEVPLEYQVKATYLYNFVKFIEWPGQPAGPLNICVAGRNPFGTVLDDLLANETINGRPVRSRVILEPDPGCQVVFVPSGAAATAYLRAARGAPVLTVGEESDFIELGGIISLYLDSNNVRFTINPSAAERAKLRISSRLLTLARIVDDMGERQ
jgi:hypothetical protein